MAVVDTSLVAELIKTLTLCPPPTPNLACLGYIQISYFREAHRHLPLQERNVKTLTVTILAQIQVSIVMIKHFRGRKHKKDTFLKYFFLK